MRFVGISLALLVVALARAEDVPQFRGPGGSGLSTETGLPVQWDKDTNIRWKAELPGRGLSNPVIAQGRVYLTACTGFDYNRLHVLCFALKDGKQLWDRQFWVTGTTLCHNKTNMAAPTAVTDGERVYALFATGDLACLDRDGRLVWYRTLVGDYPTVGNNVGMAASPVLWQDVLIVCLQNAGESFAAGIDKHTGQNRWRVPRPRGINWVTPLVIDNAGQPEVLFQASPDLSAHDPATGKLRWSLKGAGLSSAPTPIFGDGTVFAPGGKFLALKPGASETPEILWESGKLPTGYTSPVYHQGKVYTLSGRGVINCADAKTGKALWSQRVDGEYSASPLIAEGRLYAANEEGVTSVVQLGDTPKVLSTNPLEGPFLASPVASAGALFLRSDRYLYCIAVKK